MDNPFKKIISGGLSLFKNTQGESVIGIDIGTSSIKVVQLKKKNGKAVLETYGALSLGPYAELAVGQVTNLSSDKLAQAITDVLRETSATTKDSAISIPSSASLIFTIELPSSIKESDIKSTVPTEARKYIPVPISEVSLDWWAIPKKQESFEDSTDPNAKINEEKNEVLVVAIHNDTIAKYQEVVKKADIQASFFEIEIFSAVRSCFGHEMASVLLMDFGASKTKLSIVEHGVVRSFHIVNRGSQDLTMSLSKSLAITFEKAEQLKREFGLSINAEDHNISEICRLGLDYIFSESNSVVLNYEKKYNKTISKVIITGGGTLLKGFPEYATSNFRSPVELGNPFAKTEAPAFLEQILSQTGPEFAVALGLALRKLQ
jgi:type IV pilus assembly protein PilM